jgi:hypothetical protein
VYRKEKIEVRILDSLLLFLNNLIKKSSFNLKQENLIKARNMMIELRNNEREEMEEEQNELESLINF